MLSTKQKLYYASCRFGTSILLNIVQVATIYIYNDHFNLDPFLNGVGNAAGKLTIAFSGFFFGWISDILPSNFRIGRRKIFMVLGAPLLAFSFIMLYIPHFFLSVSGGAIWSVFLWLLTWNSAFHFFYGFLLTPYQSWMPEITLETERMEVSGLQNTANLLAAAVGIGYSFLLAGIFEELGGLQGIGGLVLVGAAIFFAIIEIIGFIPTLLSIKERPANPPPRDILREFRVVLTNKNYVIWLIGQGIFSIGLIMVTSLALNFVKEVLGFTTVVKCLIFGALLFGTAMASFILWIKFAHLHGKRKALVVGLSWMVIVLPFTVVVGKLPLIPTDMQGYLFSIAIAIGLAAYYIFPYAIIADIADQDERVTNENRAGMYTGFNSIPLNIFQAISLGLSGLLLEFGKTGLMWLGPVAATFVLLSIPIINKGHFDPFMETTKTVTTQTS